MFDDRRLSLIVPAVDGSFTALMMAVPEGTAPDPAADVCVVPSGNMMPVGITFVPAAKRLVVRARSAITRESVRFMIQTLRTGAYAVLTAGRATTDSASAEGQHLRPRIKLDVGGATRRCATAKMLGWALVRSCPTRIEGSHCLRK